MDIYRELRKAPFLRLFIPFAAGICFRWYIPVSLNAILILLALSFTMLLFSWLYRNISQSFSLSWVYGIIVYGVLFCTGAFLVHQKLNDKGFDNVSENSGFIVADVLDTPDVRERNTRVLLNAGYFIDSLEVYPVSGKVFAYLPASNRAASLKPGDRLIIRNLFRKIENPGNPYEFDLKRYMLINGIRRSAFPDDNDWFKAGYRERISLQTCSSALRERLLGIYRKYGLKGNELAVASALTLGYRSGLDDEIRSSYAASGAMHILAVSGLHVGIFFMVLHFLLMFIEKFRNGRKIKAVIIILCIWFYALLTGLYPSVLRASAMFTFVSAGLALNRNSNIFNTLAASAFFLLIFDPFMLFTAGFQLSYMAVAGIVFFQPRIYSLIKFRNRLADRIWALTGVSIGAQLATFPIALYYFNQFPNYFLLTNLFAIPLATVIIYSGILLFIFSPVGFIAVPLAWFFNFTLTLLNSAIMFVQQLPFSVTGNIKLSMAGVILIYVVITAATAFFITKNRFFLKVFLLVLIAGMGMTGVEKIRLPGQRMFILYNSGNHSLVHFIEGRKSLLMSSSVNDEVLQSLANNYENVIIHKKLKDTEIRHINNLSDTLQPLTFLDSFAAYGNFALFGEKTFYFAVDDDLNGFTSSGLIPVDYLVVTGTTNTNPEVFFNIFDPALVIADSSVPYYTRGMLEKYCSVKDIEYYPVRDKGAFVKVK